VSPACLPWTPALTNFEGFHVTASGFGRTVATPEANSEIPEILQKLTLELANQENCSEAYAERGTTASGTTICAFAPPGKDSCNVSIFSKFNKHF